MADLEAAKAALAQEEEDQAKAATAERWKPEAGDELIGTLIEGKWLDTQHGETRVLTIEDADGQVWTVWAGLKVLSDLLQTQAPKVGGWISIKFGGKQPPKKAGGYSWNQYFLRCEESDREHWDDSYAAMTGQNQGQQSAGIAPDDGLSAPY